MSTLEDLLQICTVKLSIPGQLGWGTGSFVAPGLILTCAHVVRKAANSPITVFYPAQQLSLSAIAKAKADDGKTLDLALVELSEPLPDHPCVFLDEEPVAIGQALYSYGYLESYTNAAPVRPVYEGLTGDTPPLLKLQGAQIERGISGAALLNLKTGKVCGMIKETRAAGFDLGGGAIPTRVILQQFPELRELQRVFYEGDRRWVNLINKQSEIDFQPYLNSIITTYAKWQRYYTLTDAEGKQRQLEESAPLFDFGLMVQTVPKQERQQPQQEQSAQEKVERFSVLDGLRKYAFGQKSEPVLLVGRPGSGKSTGLAKLLLEEASSQTSEVSKTSEVSAHLPRIPVLVELRYWQGSLSDLIHNAIARHDMTLKAMPLDRLLTNALLLFDGVNELPSEPARTELIAFRRNHANLPMIFTTRDLSLGGDLGIERKLEMLPLTEFQMQAFIRAYIPEQAEAMLRQLKDRLREFGQTPLLLWMLCEVFQQAPDNQLPSNLGGVFQAFATMYERSSVRKHEVALLKGDVKPLSDRRLWKKALMAIASFMMQGETPVDFRPVIHRDEAETELSKLFPNEKFPVRDILDDLLKYHLLQNQTTDQIEFRHQLIQEYYAAEYLLKLLPNLTDEQLKRDYLNYLKWTEPVALMLALVKDEAQALRLVKLTLQIDLALGSRLAGEVKPEFQGKTVGFVEVLVCPDWLKLKCLEVTQSKHSIPGLLKLVENSNYGVRWSAAEVLGKISSEEAIDGLLKMLEHFDSDARKSAAMGLGEIGTKAAIPGLLKLIDDHWVRWTAASALGKIGSEEAIDGLLKLIQMENACTGECESAATALGKIGSEEAMDGLLKCLESSRSDVRTSAVKALGEIGTEVAIDWLLKLLEHYNPDMRGSAAEALGRIGSEAAIDGLLKLVEDSDSGVRWSAAKALGKIGSEVVIPMLLKLVEDSDGIMVRFHVAFALSQVGTAAAIDGLLKLLEHSDADVRSSAASALGRLGTAVAIDGLLKLLEDVDADVRWRAASALGEIGSEATIPGLLKLLEDIDADVRTRAAEALGKIGTESAIPKLLKLLEDTDWSVRTRAAEALGRIGTESAIPMLFKWLENSDSDARGIASSALGNIAKKRMDAISSHLPHLLTLISTDAGISAYYVICDIQASCKYYNYEIFQAHLAAQNADRSQSQNGDRSSTTIYNIDQVGMLNTGNVSIHGDQIGES